MGTDNFPDALYLLDHTATEEPWLELELDEDKAKGYPCRQRYIADRAGGVDWEQLARSFVHPTKIGILQVLSIDRGRAMSPNEIRVELQIDLGTCDYHAKDLAKAGLIELVDTQQRRGATEHYYRLSLEGGS